MWTPQTLKDGKKTSYGLGVVVEGQGQQLKIWHNGAQDETKSGQQCETQQQDSFPKADNLHGY